MADFLQEFKRRYDASCQQLDKIGTTEGRNASSTEIEASLDEIANQLKQLKLYLSDNATVLTKYDLKRRQGDIKSLEDAIANKSNELLAAKTSFAFTNITSLCSNNNNNNNNNISQMSLPSSTTDQQATDLVVSDDKSFVGVSSEDTFTIRNVADQDLIFEGESATTQLAGKELELSNVRNCRIKVFTHLPAVRVDKARDCDIICGPVSTSVFVEEATNCSFVMAAQQFRIHSSRDCRFYIHVTSKAIIESCRDLAFAPYNLEYAGMLDDFWSAKLRLYDVTNNWDHVDDFDWPSASAKRPSPNWSILPENKRVKTWN